MTHMRESARRQGDSKRDIIGWDWVAIGAGFNGDLNSMIPAKQVSSLWVDEGERALSALVEGDDTQRDALLGAIFYEPGFILTSCRRQRHTGCCHCDLIGGSSPILKT